MVSNPAAPGSTIADRFARLKALQRPASLPKVTSELRYVEDPEEMPRARQGGLPYGSERLAQLLGATVKQNNHGEHLSLHCWHGGHIPYVPGSLALNLLLPDAPEDVQDPERWLFLDTETTGLCGGTGTYPFLVGLAWWDGGGLEIEQLFMRDFGEERSLLAALAERMEERPVLVTFNGKSFDWPLLETRFRMSRKVSAPHPRAHLDFLHPARNLWKLRLGSVRLSQLERNVLGWDRGEDMDSALIPAMYLDFLRDGPADPLVPVFLHNQMDLRGLASLAVRIVTLLDDEEANSGDGLELFGLSRMCERRGQTDRARRMYEQTIGSDLPGETDRAARAALARLAKRDGDLARACKLWETITGNSREGYEAWEQLAIYYEHQERNPSRALDITREALAQLRRARQLRLIGDALYHSTRSRFEHRVTRLQRKSRRSALDLLEYETGCVPERA
jgi:uncharacterized protein YprB with RNaseH-like and TPR domain